MKVLSSAIVVLLFSISAQAINYFAGAGLLAGQFNFKQAGQSSTFDSYGPNAEAGADFTFGNNFGFKLLGDYGHQQAHNNTSTSNYIEDANNTYWAAKAGFTLDNATFGGGIQNYNLTIKSLSSTSSYLENDYKGSIPVYFLSYALNAGSETGLFFRTVIEVSNAVGKINDLSINDLSVRLSLQLVTGSK